MKVTLVENEEEEFEVTLRVTGKFLNGLATWLYCHRLVGQFLPEVEEAHKLVVLFLQAVRPLLGGRLQGRIE